MIQSQSIRLVLLLDGNIIPSWNLTVKRRSLISLNISNCTLSPNEQFDYKSG